MFLFLYTIHFFNNCANMHLHCTGLSITKQFRISWTSRLLNIVFFGLSIKGCLSIGRFAHYLIQGTEEDRQILMSDCQVNIKEEKTVEKSREVKSNQTVVQLNVSLDSYLPPGPRQPDTLVMASRRSAQHSQDIL